MNDQNSMQEDEEMKKKIAKDHIVIDGAKFYSVNGLSKPLGRHPVTIRGYFQDKTLKGRKIFGGWWISEEELKNHFQGKRKK